MSVMTPPGLAIELDEDRLGLRRKRGLEARRIVGIGEARRPAEILVGVIELVDRAAVKLGRRDELVARLHQGVEGDELRRMAGSDGKRPAYRLRARRPSPRARRRSDCRCANRCCRKLAGRRAKPRGRHRRRRMRSSDRSGLPARRSPDRVGRPREPPRWRSPVLLSSGGPLRICREMLCPRTRSGRQETGVDGAEPQESASPTIVLYSIWRSI